MFLFENKSPSSLFLASKACTTFLLPSSLSLFPPFPPPLFLNTTMRLELDTRSLPLQFQPFLSLDPYFPHFYFFPPITQMVLPVFQAAHLLHPFPFSSCAFCFTRPPLLIFRFPNSSNMGFFPRIIQNPPHVNDQPLPFFPPPRP